MILLYLKKAILLAAVAAAAYGLCVEFGPWSAAFTCATVAVVACVIGMVLLRTSTIGQVTWRNYLAGYLIPWGWRLNRGRLWPVGVISWVVWTAVSGAAALLRADEPSLGMRAALLAAWLIDASALMFLLGTIVQATPGSRLGSVWKLVAFITVVLCASVGLYVAGQTTAALIVGGGPPAVICGAFGLVLLIFSTVGRNTRWN